MDLIPFIVREKRHGEKNCKMAEFFLPFKRSARGQWSGMVARFAPPPPSFAIVSDGVHIGAAAGMPFGAGFSQKALHRAILRHAVLVRRGTSVKSGVVLVVFASNNVR